MAVPRMNRESNPEVKKNNPFEDENGAFGNQQTEQQPQSDLGKDHPRQVTARGAALHDGNHDDGQHVGAGVVAAAFHFQDGRRLVPQA